MPEVRSDDEAARDRELDVLYVTYDGLLEPLGRSQVLSYVSALAQDGFRIGIISFEKRRDFGKASEREALRCEMEALGILWKPLIYHRHPRLAATTADLVRGSALATRLARKYRPGAIHARSYVAGLMALAAKALTGAPFVFDMRGFWPEERVELGLFRPQGLLYRAAKRAEASLLSAADHVVVLTESAKAILREREASDRLAARAARETPISIVPCCVDLERYRPLPRDTELSRRYGLDQAVVVGNIGAFNRRYLTPEMFRFFFHLKAHRPELRFVYLTQQSPDAVRKAARGAGLREDDTLVLRVDSAEVPRWLSLFRLGVFFLRPSYAAKASSFTKLGEFLAAGVPVVTNTGVGDVDRILGSERCGLLLPGLTDRELSAFARKALPLLEGDSVPEATLRRCRSTALAHFALAEGVRRYIAIYESVAPSSAPAKEAEVAAEMG